MDEPASGCVRQGPPRDSELTQGLLVSSLADRRPLAIELLASLSVDSEQSGQHASGAAWLATSAVPLTLDQPPQPPSRLMGGQFKL